MLMSMHLLWNAITTIIEIPREPVIPEETPSPGKAAVIKTPTVNVEPSVPVAQKTRTSSVKLVPSRLADFDVKR